MSKKLLITDKDVGIIEDFAHIAFRKRPTFGTMSSKEMQAFCLLEGFAMFLNYKDLCRKTVKVLTGGFQMRTQTNKKAKTYVLTPCYYSNFVALYE
jgi:hypothetical protein